MNSPKKINLSMLLYFIWQIIGVQIILAVGAVLLVYIFPNMGISDYIINVMILQDAVMLLLPILFGIKLLGDKASEIIPVKGLTLWNVLYIVMIGFLMLPVMEFISVITSFFCPDTTGDVQEAILSAPFLVGILIMAVVPAVLEETMFRGLVFGGLKKFGRKRAMVLSAFYFGLFHLNGYQIPYAVFSGIILAITAEYAGTILAPILLHFTVNGIQVAAYYYYSSAAGSLAAEETADLSVTLSDVCGLGLMAAVFFVLLLLMLRGFIRYNKNLKKTNNITEAEESEESEEPEEKIRFADVYLIISVLFVGAYLALSPLLEAFIESLA